MNGLVDKGAFLAGCVCPTQGWYARNTTPKPPGPGLQWRFFVGTDVARRARAWLGEGQYIQRTPVDTALRVTNEAVNMAEPDLLFEASFSWGGLVARADAMRRSEGGWTLIEIKAGKSRDDGGVNDEYLDDIAYTTCVASGAGLLIVRTVLILLNREYRLGGDAEMFVEIDVTEETLARATLFRTRAQEIAKAVSAQQRPEPALQFVCKKCDFFNTECVGKDIPDPVFTLPRLSEKKFAEVRAYERVSHIPSTLKLTDNQQRVADVIRSGQPYTDTVGLRILDDVIWPAYYLDFEAVMPPLPWFGDSPPYDTVPFQYSLHIHRGPNGAPNAAAEHRQYLAASEGDWRRELTQRLIVDLGKAGSIIVYSSYEKVRLTALATLFPDLRDPLEDIVARLFDLERVFKHGYCHPGFAGRTSIKKVLPVMVPELRYDVLDVSNGDDAAGMFALMRVGEYSTETHDGHRDRLLEYCKLDTTAMIRLHEEVLRLYRQTVPATDRIS